MTYKRALAVYAAILLLLGVGFAVRSHYQTSLTTARVDAQRARQEANAALVDAQHSRDLATALKAHADSADSAAARHTTVVTQTKVEYRTLIAAAPDTCKPVIDAANAVIAAQDSVITDRTKEVSYLRVALDTTTHALDQLRSSTAKLSHATAVLESASKPSLLAKLIPHLGTGITAGVDAFGKPNAVIGITLGWTF